MTPAIARIRKVGTYLPVRLGLLPHRQRGGEMLETMSTLAHTDSTALLDHVCQERVYAFCTACGRKTVWCQMSTEDIKAVTSKTYRCDGCRRG